MSLAHPTTWLMLAAVAALLGCDRGDAETGPTRLPRPVKVFRLAETDPNISDRVTGSVASWKTEDLGFEVGGRVRFVIEPETEVDGAVYGSTGDTVDGEPNEKPIVEGQVLAVLDDTRYRLAVQSAEAQIETATQQKKSVSIEVERVLPAQREAVLADLTFRKSEVDRNLPLVQSGTVTRAKFDKIKADYESAAAALAEVDARLLAKQAEEASLEARINELGESLAQAKRDVEDCELRASYRGQAAKVHVIPGGVVQAGQPVVTVQMMDPIKIDLEVSAATSRQLNYRDVVQIYLPESSLAGADSNARRALVYTIDPVADPATRTFTVTLLVRNEKVRTPVPAELGEDVVRTQDVWEMHEANWIKPGTLFLEQDSIHQQDNDHYVWKITNWGQFARKETPVLEVTPIQVITGDLRVDWLGLWTFREVKLAEGQDFDLEKDFVAGKLEPDRTPAGGKILFDREQWRMRPGDLVEVNLAGERHTPGYYVPIDSIQQSEDQEYVFVVNEGRCQRVPVQVSDGPDTFKRISGQLQPGMQLVASGAHYLVDGEAVKVVQEVQVTP